MPSLLFEVSDEMDGTLVNLGSTVTQDQDADENA